MSDYTYAAWLRRQEGRGDRVGRAAASLVEHGPGIDSRRLRGPGSLTAALLEVDGSPETADGLAQAAQEWHEAAERRRAAEVPSIGVWLAAQAGHSDAAIACLARWWSTHRDGRPAATVSTLAAAVAGSYRLSAALERAVVAFHVQHLPGALDVHCASCHALEHEACTTTNGHPMRGFHQARRNNSDGRLRVAVARDLRTVQSARRAHQTSTTNHK